jgi:selenocysteine lyase/cysteine desulfurase
MSTKSTNVIAGNGNKDVKLPIYMDNHATTRTDPRVVEEMLPYFTEKYGNAASRNHEFGWVAEQAVEQARERIAKLIGATAKEIIFTSGATESDNLAIKGVAEMYKEKGNHIITQAIEHKAVLDTCKRLEKYGFRVTYLPVQKDGRIDLDDLKRAMDDKTILVTIMAANNEIGVLQTDSRDWCAVSRARCALPYRRGTADWQSSIQRDPGQCGHRFDFGTQAVWTEGSGRVVCSP